jgi:hypothetical protein
VRRAWILILVACVLGFGAHRSTATASSSVTAPRTLRFLDRTRQFLPIDLRQNRRPRAGDRFATIDALYNRAAQFGKPAGALVGRAEAVCTFLPYGEDGEFFCNGIVHVPDGFLAFSGTQLERPATYFAVTGGGGAYTNARGSIRVSGLRDDSALVLVRVIP